MAYNTGNPVGSTDPRDFKDNAQGLDEVMLSSSETFVDRLGNTRRTLRGYEVMATGVPAVEASLVAQAAADAAFVNADVYQTVAAGIAAVVDGEQFQVVSDDGKTLYRYRRDSAAAASIVAQMPTSDYYTQKIMPGYRRSPYAWGVIDKNRRLAVYVDQAGKFGTPSLPDHAGRILDLLSTMRQDYNPRSGYLWGVVDTSGRIPLGLNRNGDLVLKGRRIQDIIPQNTDQIIADLVALKNHIYPSESHIACWGDSLTQGAGGGGVTYPAVLSNLTGRTVLNLGLGGQSSDKIIARQGAIGTTLNIDGNQIPPSGPVLITDPSIDLLANAGGAGSIAGTINGIHGTLSWTLAGGYQFTRDTAGDPVTCHQKTLFLPDKGDTPYYLPVFWIGRNQFNYFQSAAALDNQVENIKQNIAAAVSSLAPVEKRFVVLGVTSGSDTFEFIGTDNYNAKRTLAAALSRAYPDNFIDLDTILVNAGTGVDGDAEDFANGIVPRSLRADSQHLNAAGYQIVAEAVKKHITERGW